MVMVNGRRGMGQNRERRAEHVAGVPRISVTRSPSVFLFLNRVFERTHNISVGIVNVMFVNVMFVNISVSDRCTPRNTTSEKMAFSKKLFHSIAADLSLSRKCSLRSTSDVSCQMLTAMSNLSSSPSSGWITSLRLVPVPYSLASTNILGGG